MNNWPSDATAERIQTRYTRSISSSPSEVSAKPIAPRTAKKYAAPCVIVTLGTTDQKTEISGMLAAMSGINRLNRTTFAFRVPDQKRKRERGIKRILVSSLTLLPIPCPP